jgi:FeS assembly SUF system protein
MTDMDEQDRKIEVEELGEAPAPPPRARVDQAAVDERPRDYLEGFLSRKPAGDDAEAPGGDLYEAVVQSLKEIFDPEIPVNIYDLGLIYGIDIVGGHVIVTMTLTTPHCPVAESMPGEVELRVGAVPGIGSAEVNLIWDPPWDPQKMSDEAKLELGML